MKLLSKAVTCIDLIISAFFWLLIWFIDGSEPVTGYRIIYIICMLNAAAMIWAQQKTRKRHTANGSR